MGHQNIEYISPERFEPEMHQMTQLRVKISLGDFALYPPAWYSFAFLLGCWMRYTVNLSPWEAANPNQYLPGIIYWRHCRMHSHNSSLHILMPHVTSRSLRRLLGTSCPLIKRHGIFVTTYRSHHRRAVTRVRTTLDTVTFQGAVSYYVKRPPRNSKIFIERHTIRFVGPKAWPRAFIGRPTGVPQQLHCSSFSTQLTILCRTSYRSNKCCSWHLPQCWMYMNRHPDNMIGLVASVVFYAYVGWFECAQPLSVLNQIHSVDPFIRLKSITLLWRGPLLDSW